VTALGIDEMGCKTILAFHQGPSEDETYDGLFSALAARGLNFRHLHLKIMDGSKAVRAGVRRCCGESSPILRCQLHERRNIVRHFPALTRTVVQFVFSFVLAGGFHSARGCENLKKVVVLWQSHTVRRYNG
jgi:Transposase, Mutator family